MTEFFDAMGQIFTSESTYTIGALFAGFLAFAASGEWVAERAGTLNISVEGMLLSGAFTSAMGYHVTGSTIVAMFAGIAGGLIVASVQAEMSHRLTADQFVVGLTLNILVLGLAAFLDYARRFNIPTILERKGRKGAPAGSPCAKTRGALDADLKVLAQFEPV